MQEKRRSRKNIYIYLLIFFMVTTFNNKYFLNYKFFEKNKFEVIYKNEIENNNIKNFFLKLSNKNLFFLKKFEIKNQINSEPIVESFFIFKKYPSILYVDIINTKFLAVIKKNLTNYFIGSNGNLIKFYENNYDLPFVYGEFETDKFLQLINIINESNFDYNEVKNFYYFKSKRWDIEFKNGLVIKLPRDSIDKSLEMAIKILENNQQKNISNIDLRQKDQIILW